MAMEKEFTEDTVILTENGVGRNLYMVISGTVALYVNYKKEDEYLIGLCNKGTVFGEMGALCHSPSIYTAVAITDVKVAIFSEFELDDFVRRYPDKALGIMRCAARMNAVFSLNLKMLMKDQNESQKLLHMMSEAINHEVNKGDDSIVNSQWYFYKEE